MPDTVVPLLRGLSGVGDAAALRVTVVGAGGLVAYSLLPMIAKGDAFGRDRRMILQCLDLNQSEVVERMRALEMELADGNFPLLQDAFFTEDEARAFEGADYAILLGAFPQPQDAAERRQCMEKNAVIFRTLGIAIDRHASRDCKVLVAGHPACTNALLCSYGSASLPRQNFFGLARLDVNRAVGLLARRARVSVGDVRNVVVWGASGTCPDLEHAMIFGRPASSALSSDEDRRWLRERFEEECSVRGASVQRARKAGAALSVARAVVDQLRDLHVGTPPGVVTSLGVWSDGNEYGVAAGLIFAFPVLCAGGGRWRIAPALRVGSKCNERIREAETALLSDRELVRELARKHGV